MHTSDSLIEWMQNNIDSVFKNIDKSSCSFTIDSSAEAFLTKPGFLSKLMSDSIAEVTSKNCKPEMATDGGTSDARFIKDYCEVAELGIRNQTLHQVNEFVYLNDLKDLQKIYLKILENYFSKN